MACPEIDLTGDRRFLVTASNADQKRIANLLSAGHRYPEGSCGLEVPSVDYLPAVNEKRKPRDPKP
jgi:hypothetical protein